MGERADMADEVLPPWPDNDGARPIPHPDGRPWRKACGECLFRRSDPQDRENEQAALGAGWPETHFWCVHRTDESCNRVCASYAAI